MALVLCGDGTQLLDKTILKHHGAHTEFALTFFDPPFGQGKDYAFLKMSYRLTSIGDG